MHVQAAERREVRQPKLDGGQRRPDLDSPGNRPDPAWLGSGAAGGA
jgi:hypothetical protein